jgi:hypothetical protein
VDPVPAQLPQKNPKECPEIELGTSVFVVFNANHYTTEAVKISSLFRAFAAHLNWIEINLNERQSDKNTVIKYQWSNRY